MARRLRVARRTVEDRLERMGLHFERTKRNERRGWSPQGEFQFDELETFEHHRVLRPVTLGVLVHAASGFLVETAAGTLRARGGTSEKSRERRRRYEERYGRRRNESRRVTEACLGVLRGSPGAIVVTDAKPLYRTVLQPIAELRHERVWGRPKGPGSALFWVNHTMAKMRDGMSRLRRRSWCASKKREKLERHAAIWGAVHNYWRWRTNWERRTPAMGMGVARRRLRLEELYGWRQDWGTLSRRLGSG
jgi:hypothetical protein